MRLCVVFTYEQVMVPRLRKRTRWVFHLGCSSCNVTPTKLQSPASEQWDWLPFEQVKPADPAAKKATDPPAKKAKAAPKKDITPKKRPAEKPSEPQVPAKQAKGAAGSRPKQKHIIDSDSDNDFEVNFSALQ